MDSYDKPFNVTTKFVEIRQKICRLTGLFKQIYRPFIC